jgi:hypothetical protein
MGTTSTKLILPPALGSYANIFKPRAFEGQAPKYSIVLIWPKEEKEKLKPLIAAIIEAARAKFGEKAAEMLKGNKLKNPLRDGDVDRADEPSFKGCYFVTASASADRQPGVVDAKVQPVFEESEAYSGCIFRASVNLFAFDKGGNRGVAVGLNNLQVVKKGTRLDGRKNAEADFASFKEEPGEGAAPVTGTTSSGLVPQVTMGAMAEASMRTSRSKTASGSETRVFQLARAMSQAPPLGAEGRPRR